MKAKNETLIYGLLGLIALGGLVYLVVPKKEEGIEEDEVIDTKKKDTPDDEISNEQKTPDKNVEAAKDNTGKLTSLIGKNVFTKLAGVQVRNTAMVKNGVINNIYGEIPSKDILIGKVTSVLKKGEFNWIGVKLSQQAYDIIQSEKNIIFRDLRTNIPALKWVREDVIKLK
jgi:hypothetical protein